MTAYPIVWAMAFCTLQADDPGKTLKEFASKEGRFKVQMPGTPKELKQKAAGIEFVLYIIETKDEGVAVGYADLPIPGGETNEQIQTRLDGAVQGMVGNIGGKVDKANKIELAKKHPGRDVFASVPQKEMQLRARIYLVDKRMYQLLVFGKKAYVEAPEMEKFLNSLELVEEKKEKPEK